MRLVRPEALLFDLGRVVIDLDFERALAVWAAHGSSDPAHLRACFREDEPYRQHEIGAISGAEYFANLRAAFGIALSDAQFLEGWNAIFVGESPGVCDLLARA